jgi:hypothetical protein
MLALQIEIDDQPPLIAGAEDWSLLSVDVIALRGEPQERNEPDIDASVGGLTGRNAEGVAHHFRWPRVPLTIGSTVKVTLVAVASVHAPAKRHQSDSKVQEDPFTEEELREMNRQYYLELKQEFEGANDA